MTTNLAAERLRKWCEERAEEFATTVHHTDMGRVATAADLREAMVRALEEAVVKLESFPKDCLGINQGTQIGDGIAIGRTDIIEASTNYIRPDIFEATYEKVED